MQLPPDMVLFDCDGVIVDSEKVTNLVLRDNLARHGLSLDLERIMDLFVGGTMKGVMLQAREMGADLPDLWLDTIYAEMFDRLAQECEPVHGINSVLNKLDEAGVPYAIGSNGPHAKMAITLTKVGLMERFEGKIFSREDVPHPKPAPDVYLKAAASKGVDPLNCVVVEDSASGAKAAKAAGMVCFGYAADTPEMRLAPICDEVFSKMDDLPLMLGLT